ncbi:MAG: hypothetical protein P1V34_18520 [Alphaproteobacteria bacterium]|nr:hypothetical protein [Alphaproteobacteria bacterium]
MTRSITKVTSRFRAGYQGIGFVATPIIACGKLNPPSRTLDDDHSLLE